VIQPELNEDPADHELRRTILFSEPLIPMTTASLADENRKLAQAIQAHRARQRHDDYSALLGFVAANRASRWSASIWKTLGGLYRSSGYYSRAMEAWENAYSAARQERSQPASSVADIALGELAELNSRLGRFDRIKELLVDAATRQLSGPAAVKIDAAREGLGRWTTPPKGLPVWPDGLGQDLQRLAPGGSRAHGASGGDFNPARRVPRRSCELSVKAGLDLVPAQRGPSSPVPGPVGRALEGGPLRRHRGTQRGKLLAPGSHIWRGGRGDRRCP
jgi:hypothetical protein